MTAPEITGDITRAKVVVETVYARRENLHQNVARLGIGGRDLFVLENTGIAEFVNDCCFHDFSLCGFFPI